MERPARPTASISWRVAARMSRALPSSRRFTDPKMNRYSSKSKGQGRRKMKKEEHALEGEASARGAAPAGEVALELELLRCVVRAHVAHGAVDGALRAPGAVVAAKDPEDTRVRVG